MHTSGGTPFAATVRVIDRIHYHATNSRSHAAPAHRTSLADGAEAMLLVPDLTNRRPALHMDAPDFAGTQTQLRINAFARKQLSGRTGGARQLAPLPGIISTQ
jgi:hypothetical protein